MAIFHTRAHANSRSLFFASFSFIETESEISVRLYFFVFFFPFFVKLWAEKNVWQRLIKFGVIDTAATFLLYMCTAYVYWCNKGINYHQCKTFGWLPGCKMCVCVCVRWCFIKIRIEIFGSYRLFNNWPCVFFSPFARFNRYYLYYMWKKTAILSDFIILISISILLG